MVYNKQTTGLIIRMLIILCTMMCIPLAIGLVDPAQLLFTLLMISLVLAGLILELYSYLNRGLKELIQFLDNIRNRDFNLRFNEEESRGVRKKLYRTFNEVLEVYREIRIEREVHFRFLEHIIELIEIGIIVFDQEGRVVLSNTAASNMTGIHDLRSWQHVVRRNSGLASKVGSIKNSGRFLYEAADPGPYGRLMVQVSRTRMLEQEYSLMSIQDISSVIDQKETGAWINLLRTLNHEIRNSVTPICSLTDTLIMILTGSPGPYKSIADLSQDNLDDIIESVETLQQRSKSLHNFIDEYHKLTKLPAPEPVLIGIHSLFGEIQNIFRIELEQASVRLRLDVRDPELEIRADRGLIGQVMINLIRNSLEALEGHVNPEIVLSGAVYAEGLVIGVSDNGNGIDPAILEDVFVPFFTTKTAGSGIGLSLVRQIMRLHGGHVRIRSQIGSWTKVCLVFPQGPDSPTPPAPADKR